MGALQKAQVVARKQFEKLYKDKLTVTVKEMIFDEVTSSKKPKLTTPYKEVPCKLDFKSESVPDKEGHNYSLITQYLLYTSPSVVIKEGSTIEVVTESGLFNISAISGSVQDYPTHNEYPLKEVKRAI